MTDSDFSIAAWFQLANSDAFMFSNTLKNDVVIRTTDYDQRILIGPTSTSTEEKPFSTLTISSNELSIHGDLVIDGGNITKGPNDNNLKIEGVSFSNNSLKTDEFTVNKTATFKNTVNISELKYGGRVIFTEDGQLTGESIGDEIIKNTMIKKDTIDATRIKSNSLKSHLFANQSVTERIIKDHAVNTNHIADNVITNEKHQDYSIDNRILQDSLIDTRNYRNHSVTTDVLSNEAVTSEKLAHELSLQGPLTINNGSLFLNLPSNISHDNNASLDLYKNISLAYADNDENITRVYLENKNGTLEVNTPIQIKGDLHYTGQLYQNGELFRFTEFFPVDAENTGAENNTNLVYDGGHLGIHTTKPLERLHTNGNIMLNSNLYIGDHRKLFLAGSDSNLGINTENAVATLDITGNLAINHEPIIDENRNIFNIPSLDVKKHNIIGNKNEINMDVQGDVKFDLHTFMLNKYHMFIHSEGRDLLEDIFEDGPFYYKLADLRSPLDTLNTGAFIITGNIGNTDYNRNAHIKIVIANRNFDTTDDMSKIGITSIQGGDVSQVASFTDIVMYRNINENDTLHIYLVLNNNSNFNLELQGSSIIKDSLNINWKNTKSSLRPDDQNSALYRVKSLIDNNSVASLNNIGKQSFGGDVYSEQNIFAKHTLCNNDNISTKGNHIRSFSEDAKRSLFDIYRHEDSPQISLNTNYRKIENGEWRLKYGNQGCLQLKMTNNTDESDISDSVFSFRGTNSVDNDDNIPIELEDWMSIKNSKVGINGIVDPIDPLHIKGRTRIEDGQLYIYGTDQYDDFFNDFRKRAGIKILDPEMVHNYSQSIVFGKDNGPTSYGKLSYIFKDENVGNSKITLGFRDKDILHIEKDHIGINIEFPKEVLELRGNILCHGGKQTIVSENEKFVYINGWQKTYENTTSSNSIWEKIALLKSLDQDKNQGTIEVKGLITNQVGNIDFEGCIFFNAVDSELCSSSLVTQKYGINFFISYFDIAAYIDNKRNIHLYLKSNTQNLHVNLNIKINQTQGSGITYNFETEKIYTNIPYRDPDNFPVLRNTDEDIEGDIRFSVHIHEPSENKSIVYDSELGQLVIGQTSYLPSYKLNVGGRINAHGIDISNGILNSDEDISINGRNFFTKEGDFITRNIPNKSLTFEKLTDGTYDDIWRDTRNRLINRNVFLQNNVIGLFTSQPKEDNTFEIGTRVTLSSNLDNDPSLYGSVDLTSSSNGLGINKTVPEFTLDVDGDINFTGALKYNGSDWRTSPFQNYENYIYAKSNMAIGEGLNMNLPSQENEKETLIILNNMSLSNDSGKNIFTTKNGYLGLNNPNPTSTFDIGGNIAINGVSIIDDNRNIKNIENLYTSSLTTLGERIGVKNRSPDYTLDINGDINLTGNVYQKGNSFNTYSNQWNGSNEGIYYDSHVGIGGSYIPSTESLSVWESMSLSNQETKGVLSLLSEPSNTFVYSSLPFIGSMIGVSNNTGQSILNAYDSNMSLGLLSDHQKPQSTLDIMGSLGIFGQEIIDRQRNMHDINTLRSSSVTMSTSNMGVNTLTPAYTLSVNGNIGFDERNIVLEVIDNILHVQGKGLSTSNVEIHSRVNEEGLQIYSQNQLPSSFPKTSLEALSGATIYDTFSSTKHVATENDHGAYTSFFNAQNDYGFIGVEGKGFFTDASEEIGNMNVISRHDMRFITNEEERVRITKDGNTGFGTAYPLFTLDIAGTGIGMGGDIFVDVDKNVMALNVNVEDKLETRTLSTDVYTNQEYNNVNIILTDKNNNDGYVRSTAKSSSGYTVFRDMLNSQPIGHIISVNSNNVYLNALTDKESTSYVNVAYKPVQNNAILPGNKNINMNTYILRDDISTNIIGNTNIVGKSLQLVNPAGHEGTTSMCINSWNPVELNEKNMELRMLNQTPSIAELHSDSILQISHKGFPYLRFSSDNTDKVVFVSSGIKFGLDRLAGGNIKQVYADQYGHLTPNSSDIRMKKNIKTIDTGLDKISKLRPVYFYWNDMFENPVTHDIENVQKSRGSKEQIGLIAQEVEKVVPESVDRTNDDMMHIDYSKIIPLLVKAVQELQEENTYIKTHMLYKK